MSITLLGNKVFALLHQKTSKSTVVRNNCNNITYARKPLTELDEGRGGALCRAKAVLQRRTTIDSSLSRRAISLRLRQEVNNTTNESEWVTAKYDGLCVQCKSEIRPGDRIYWSKLEKKAWCTACCEKVGIRDQEPRTEEKREGKGSTEITTNSSLRARWELVTADDGVIVLRRADR